MVTVQDFYERQRQALELELVEGAKGLKRVIRVPEAHRPGLSLAGYLRSHAKKRILVFGRVEMDFLRDLAPQRRIACLKSLLTSVTPAVIVSRRLVLPKELIALCKERKMPLFRSKMQTMQLLKCLLFLLDEAFAPTMTCHGCLVEVFGLGVLIQGDSSVGKSEAALGLIERGHRLISDDVVKIRRCEGGVLEGTGVDLGKHHMEVRGIGIINVANLYGAVCICDKKNIDIVVKLEVWDDDHAYDRLGLDEKTVEILGVPIPIHILPVKPGRDVVLLLETITLNHRLKSMGYHSAREFEKNLFTALSQRRLKR